MDELYSPPQSIEVCSGCKRKLLAAHNGSNHILGILCPDCYEKHKSDEKKSE